MISFSELNKESILFHLALLTMLVFGALAADASSSNEKLKKYQEDGLFSGYYIEKPGSDTVPPSGMTPISALSTPLLVISVLFFFFSASVNMAELNPNQPHFFPLISLTKDKSDFWL